MKPNFESIILDNQKIICPSGEQWKSILESGKVNGRIIPRIDIIKDKVKKNSKYEELKSCLIISHHNVMFIELLEINEELVRVHVERVVCDNCEKRALISATPGVSDLYIGLEEPEKSRNRGYEHKNLECKYCNNTYDRRYTIWQKY